MQYLEILVKLRKIIRSINLESKKIEKEFGISIPQLLVLQYLSDQEGYRSSAKDIKDYINLNASTVSGIVKRLESKGMVARIPRPDDRRAVFVTLTAQGAEVLQQSPTTLQEKMTKRLQKLSTEQVAQLDESIELLTDLMDVTDLDAAPVLTIREFPEKG